MPSRGHKRNVLRGPDEKEADAQYHRELSIMKRKLGIGDRTPLPKCPARSERKLMEFEKNGDYAHSAKAHLCALCGCGLTAGHGTDHLGWGCCHMHEKKFGEKKSAKMAEAHRNALVTRHPGIYRDLGRFDALVKREGNEAEQRKSLVEETGIARGMIQELISLLSGNGVENAEDVELEEGAKVVNAVELKEYVAGRLEPMSYKTRVELSIKMLASVAKLVTADDALRKADYVTGDQFRAWFAKLWQELKHVSEDVGAGTLTTAIQIQESMKVMFRKIGQPGPPGVR